MAHVDPQACSEITILQSRVDPVDIAGQVDVAQHRRRLRRRLRGAHQEHQPPARHRAAHVNRVMTRLQSLVPGEQFSQLVLERAIDDDAKRAAALRLRDQYHRLAEIGVLQARRSDQEDAAGRHFGRPRTTATRGHHGQDMNDAV